MKGKRGLVMGVANNRSIAWGIASAMAAEGAELAFSYQGEAFGQRVKPLAESVGSDFLVDMDVTDEASLDAGFAALKERWDSIDFVVHAIAYSDKNELTGRFINTSRDNFKHSLEISCYSFIDVARRASEMMPNGGTLGICCQADQNGVVIEITDTGVGIPPEETEKIFEPLFTKRTQGIGLGLSICRRYAEQHGGTLSVESGLGKGSKFILTLPLTHAEGPKT